MASINKCILIGNLGRDPEVRYTANGTAICNMRLATTRNWKDRNSGERMEETEWHSVVLYDRTNAGDQHQLVLSGLTTMADVETYPFRPDQVVSSVAELLDQL